MTNRKYKGDDYKCDLALQHGCVEERKPTDIMCAATCLIFFAGMIFVAFWAYFSGNLRIALSPVNAAGGFCGYDYPEGSSNTNDGFPNMYIFDPSTAYENSVDDTKVLW